MKKHLIFTFFIFLTLELFSQNAPIDVPQIFPGSPEAATLGKFGEIPVNMGIGVTNQSIPIYTIQEGGFELPISLSYYYTGLLVDDIPGITGLGWSLNAGGIITRQLRGRPDEEPNGYIGSNQIGSNWVLPYVNGQLSTADRNSFEENSASGIWDTQPDKFMISVGNVQASFYFDENKNAIIKPYKPYKIEIINGDFAQGLKVTDDSGIQYFFESTEITKRIPPFGINAILSTPVNGYISSWKLTKIILTNNRAIDLNYTSYYHTQKTISQSYTKSIGPSGCGNNLRSSEAIYSVSSKIIESISFSLGTVEFITTRPSVTELNRYLARLDKVKVKDIFNKEIFNHDLTYDNNNKTRKLLTNITINNDTGNQYQFTYKGNPSDNILFSKQDFWGYANANNTGKLININNLYGPRQPSFGSGSSGALQKIIYPTKGSTEFVYEQNTYDPGINGDEYDDFYDANNSACGIGNDPYSAIASATGGSDSDGKEFTLTEDTAAEISISVTKGTSGAGVGAKIHEKNTADDTESPCQSSLLMECDSTDPCSIATLSYGAGFLQPGDVLTKHFTKKVYLKKGTYAISAYVNHAGPDGELRASITVNLNRGNTLPPQARSRETGGIRIKTIKSCPDDNPENCVTKEYIYETPDNISQGLLFRRRNLTTYEYGTSTLSSGSVQNCVYRSYSSSSNLPLGYYMGSHIIYRQVIEKLTSVNGNNGSRKLTFNHNIPLPVAFPFAIKDDNAYKNGKLLKEETVNKNGTLVKETVNQYDFDDNLNFNRRVYSVKVGQNGFVSQGSGIYEVDITNFNASRNVDRLIQTSETEFYKDKNLNTQSFYRYNNPQGHIKEQEIIQSTNEKIINKYFYPYNFNTTITNSLSNLNRISSPIQTKVFEDQLLLSTQDNKYNNWGNNILLPEIIKTAKSGDTPEPRLIYYDYDNFGNPLEVSKADGTRIVYIWGYNDMLPIAKIENATYNQITSYVANLKTKSNADNDNCRSTNCKEQLLREALKELRGTLPKAMVTTYTYDPLIGVTSMTDPKGYCTYYHYDNFNRLEYILDDDQHVVQQVRYNYQGQQSDALGGVIIDTPGYSPKIPNQPATFTANTSGNGSAHLYTWTVDGIQEQCDTSASFTKTFTSEGTYEVKVLAYNTETKHRVSHTLSVIVKYPELVTPVLTANYTNIVKGTNVDFSASSIGGGTGNLRYEWYLNNVKQTSTTTTFRYNPNTAGTYNVYFKVIDNESGKSVNSAIRKLYAYNPLNTPNVSASKAHIEQGTTTTFTASNIGGGSGSRRYEWYVNNIKQSATGTTYAYHFPNAGTYTIKFKVVDLTMQNANSKWGANTPVLKVYPKMVVSTSQSATSVSGSSASVSFNVTGISGGSGSRQITWRAFKTVSPSQTAGSGTGTQFSFSNFATGTHEYNITATVKDNLTGKQVTRLMVVVSSISDEDCPNCGPQH
ncbi:PKD domain-containing protein [Aquimarina algiphila]|uniref:PKD domain-containing protein n=1 Tax=Aquimarina algiphila TaxID=2047982 RepID=UPI002493834F|nr:PKD domain-containing protein [Aquimarina algiphila]